MTIVAKALLTPCAGYDYWYNITFEIDRDGKVRFISESSIYKVHVRELLNMMAAVVEKVCPEKLTGAEASQAYKVTRKNDGKEEVYLEISRQHSYRLGALVTGRWIENEHIFMLASYWDHLRTKGKKICEGLFSEDTLDDFFEKTYGNEEWCFEVIE